MITCSSCGARTTKKTEMCELCGWPVGQADHDMQSEADVELDSTQVDASEPEPASVESTDPAEGGPFCHMCGWKNLQGAKFCSSCGTALQVVSSVKKAKLPPKAKKKAAEKKVAEKKAAEPVLATEAVSQPFNNMHMGMMAVAGILVIAALYMITTFSRRAFPADVPTAAQAQSEGRGESGAAASAGSSGAEALSADVAGRIADMEQEAASLTGEALILKKREIVSILSSVNRPDKAAPVQEEIAGLSNTSEDWFLAGHFFYDWMDAAQGGEARVGAAQKATEMYEKGLAINPDDLNIRTALAMSYLNTRAPMQGVQQIRQVLDTDPDHLQGNFYYGVMLMQINRLDQAKAQFERVKELVGPESPMYQQADQMLQNF